MPQETNLNVAPYFDDTEEQNDYYKVLFKPAYPVQARELNNAQSILQGQIEEVGSHFFKEGAMIIPGAPSFISRYYAVQLESDYLGIPVSLYLDKLIGVTIKGETSGITAKVLNYITDKESSKGTFTIYVEYVESSTDNTTAAFSDNEVLILDGSSISYATTFISDGEGFAKTLSRDATATGSAFGVGEGVYFLRGYFVNVEEQLLILDQYTNNSSYRVGFNVQEDLISSDVDPTLNDNAEGFNNYTAPGADRLKITASLAKKDPDDYDDQNFVQIAEIQNGQLRRLNNNTQYNVLGDNLARRTFDESGHYYVTEFVTKCEESLNNGLGNRGIYDSDQTTIGGNKPSKDLGIYKISPGKAYVAGYEVDVRASTFLDVKKPRTTKTLEDQTINFGFGPTFAVNRAYGSPVLGFTTANVLSLRSERVGIAETTAGIAGKEIGIARVYDCALEAGTYTAVGSTLSYPNQWDLSLFDVQTYTDLQVNSAVSLDVPTYIKGKNSGASGYLRWSISAGTALTVTDIKGKFSVGEKLEFNGIGTFHRTSIAATSYNITDAQSVYGVVGSAGTFTADMIPSTVRNIGIVSITGHNNGYSTCFRPGGDGTWPGIVTTGDLVRFSQTNRTLPTLARVDSVSTNSITITGVATVAGVCDGGLPADSSTVAGALDQQVTDFQIVGTVMQNQVGSGNGATSNSLYSVFPKQNIQSVDLTDSTLIIRHQYTGVTISASGVISALVPQTGCAFLPYDEERYTVIRADGQIEALNEGQFDFTGGNLTISGLTAVEGKGAYVITTQRKNNITAKSKVNNTTQSVSIPYSNNAGSGTGEDTLNDGLTYGNYPFGTRVQDPVICLNVPDVVRIYGVFESLDTSDASAPTVTLGSIDGSTGTTSDMSKGETFIGNTSGARALYLDRTSDTVATFVYLTSARFERGEVVKFQTSGVSATASSFTTGSKNITDDFKFSNGQKESIYDYSRIIRRTGVGVPEKRLKIYYESASYDSGDTGDITVTNSYDDFDFDSQIASVEGIRNTELIDARPRVTTYTPAVGARSPFEFEGRAFDGGQNSSSHILAQDENITLDYSYYLPRMDRIYLDREGTFTVKYGSPDDKPTLPDEIPGALLIANIALPAYLFAASAAQVTFIDHKRYQMSDISKLETRIKNLEYYTSLNNLETGVVNQRVLDGNGLERFKSGIFVDDFTSPQAQDSSVGVRNAFNTSNRSLRAPHYTTQINMEVGNTTIAGIGTTTAANQDSRYADVLGTNVKRANQVIMLDYDEISWLRQPFATRSESVTPFLVRFWEGSLAFNPTTDVWIDVNQMEVRNVLQEGSFQGIADAMRAEVRTAADGTRSGVSPTIWNSWQTTGVNVSTNLASTQSQDSITTMRPPTGVSEFLNMFNHSDWARSRIWGVPEDGAVNAGAGIPPNFRMEEEVVRTTTQLTSSATVGLQQQRSGTINTVNQQIDTSSLGSRIVNRNVIRFMRSRNIEFTARRLKPFTQVYPFFDNVNVARWCLSKLIEVTMTSGTFQVGETVRGIMSSSSSSENTQRSIRPTITFRVATSNHKYGPYNDPNDIFERNPYDRENMIPATYSETSTTLNVDTFSLAAEEQPQFRGYISTGMLLVGQTSGAQATVGEVRLLTDRLGTLIGNIQIPSSADPSAPTFQTGRSKLRLTSSATNSQVPGVVTTAAEEVFYSQGDLDQSQETTLSLRNARVSRQTVSDTRTITGSSDAQGTSGSTSFSTQTNPRLTGVYTDPLAQSFAVDDETGIYATSVEVYFQAKPADNNALPVTVQLREMELGIPSSRILEYSEVELRPSDITTSQDSSVATRVTFESPVYLAGGKEYALVLVSNSTEYRVWISRLGESDVSTLGRETGQVLVSSQQLLGSLFKSQNATTWTPSQYEDMTFHLYRANFVPNGSVQFFNPPNPTDVETLTSNPVTPKAKSIRVAFSTCITDTGLTAGKIVRQLGTDATAKFVGYGGSASNVTVQQPGVNYVAGTYTGVALTSITGNGINATGIVTVSSGGATAACITGTAGGSGYTVGDVLAPIAVGTGVQGSGMRFTVDTVFGNNSLSLTNVQGDFSTSAGKYIMYDSSVGVTTQLDWDTSATGVVPESPITTTDDGLHFKVFERNHGMHSSGNVVKLSDLNSNIVPSALGADYSNTATGNVTIGSTDNFAVFEGVGVAVTNPGYVKIGDEILSYTGFSGNDLTGIGRGVDNTVTASHSELDLCYKYELNGVSLRRINATHNLNEADSTTYPAYGITLDDYHIKVGMSTNGVDRTSSGKFPVLYFNSSTGAGGYEGKGTYNIPFEMCIPKFNTTTPTGTSLRASVRTVTGTSISGSEGSFVDKGFQEVSLFQENYFDSPRIVASKENEDQYLTTLPGNKSLTMNMTLATGDSRISPAIDLDQTSMVLVSNRVNAPVTNYATNFEVCTTGDDPNRFFYVTQNVRLGSPATSLSVQLDAYVANAGDLRVFYALNQDTTADQTIFVPFPGYNNTNPTRPGIILSADNNDGLSDSAVPKTDILTGSPPPNLFREYKWSVDQLPSFESFRIKIIGTSTNQATPPQLRQLRAIALA